MSANERGINLPTENDLGEGLPGYLAAIEAIESDRLKSIQEDTYGNNSNNSILKSKPGIKNVDDLAGSKEKNIIHSKGIVPTNNNPTQIGNSSVRVTDSSSKSELDEVKDILNLNESQNVSPSISTHNIVHGLDLKKEATTYVISNTRSCTLQLKSSGFVEIGSKKNKVIKSYRINLEFLLPIQIQVIF